MPAFQISYVTSIILY